MDFRSEKPSIVAYGSAGGDTHVSLDFEIDAGVREAIRARHIFREV